MEKPDEIIDDLIKLLINASLYKSNNEKNKAQTASQSQQINQQIENLDIDDYLQLFAHQKKNLNASRWNKLYLINQNLQIEQESFKHFFAIASQANYRRLEHPGYFKLLLSITKTYPPSFFLAIDKDIPRTLSNTNPFQEYLKNVLYAYAIRNPSLLYCQGINYIVAYLLMNEMSQEQTFWFLACLIENCLPDDYFKDLTTVSITSLIFNHLLDEVFPEFKLQMDQVGMEPSIFLTPWYICLFTKGFINSVSAYLLNYILLEVRKYRIGYVLLKISLALIAVVIDKDTITIAKDFRTLKDVIETKAFEVSLSEIRENLKLIELNYDIYLKIEDRERSEKEQAREEILKNRQKKMPLPPCNSEYPICFHRIQMQKRLGCIENAVILKNGFSIKSQIIENYLCQDTNPDQSDIHYTDVNQCTIGRLSHICHLNAQDYHISMNSMKLKLQRQTVHKVEILGEEEESIEQELQMFTLEERYANLSEYFQIDENYIENQINCDEDFKRELQEFSVEKPTLSTQPTKAQNAIDKKSQAPKEKFSLTAKVSNTFRKILEKMSDFKQIKELRKSQLEINSPKKEKSLQ